MEEKNVGAPQNYLENALGDASFSKQASHDGGSTRNFLAGLQNHTEPHNAEQPEVGVTKANSHAKFFHDTYQFPAARAMGMVQSGTITGKLKGTMEATTPKGSRTS